MAKRATKVAAIIPAQSTRKRARSTYQHAAAVIEDGVRDVEERLSDKVAP